MAPDQGSLLKGWRVVMTDHPGADRVAPHGPDHDTREQALAEACRRLGLQHAGDASVLRIEGPKGETISRDEIISYCAGHRPETA